MLHPAIEQHIDRSTPEGCHRWTGLSYPSGNPKLIFHGETMGARRLIREIVKGKLNKGASVLVSCGNVTCVNPEHMT